VNTPDGNTPLHYDAIRDNIEAMRALLRHGVQVDTPPGVKCYWKPLHLAAGCNIDSVKLLLQHGVDVRTKSSCHDYTPLQCAAQKGKTDVVKFLVEYL
jgi:ankyrin repeat protein